MSSVAKIATKGSIGGYGKGKGSGKMMAKRHLTKQAEEGITKPAVRRLARRGGIKRINGYFYDEIKGLLKIWLENKLQMATTYTKHARRQTLHPSDVGFALKRCGETLYGYD